MTGTAAPGDRKDIAAASKREGSRHRFPILVFPANREISAPAGKQRKQGSLALHRMRLPAVARRLLHLAVFKVEVTSERHRHAPMVERLDVLGGIRISKLVWHGMKDVSALASPSLW